MWNLLDLPATIIPVSTVDPKLDVYTDSYRPEPFRDLDSEMMADCETKVRASVRLADYTPLRGSQRQRWMSSGGAAVREASSHRCRPADFVFIHCSVGRRWQEEQLIAVSERVEAAVTAARRAKI